MNNEYIGIDFDSFLQEEGILKEVEQAAAIKVTLAKVFNSSIPSKVQTNILSFVQHAKDNFISDFKESFAKASLDEMSCESWDGFIPIQMKGGFKVTERYLNNDDPSYHFTKEQTEFNSDKTERNWKDFCNHCGEPTPTSFNDLSEEQQQVFMEEWESDLFEPAFLQLRFFATEDAVKLDVSLDYSGGCTYDWNLLVERLFSFEEVASWSEEDFERICKELTYEIDCFDKQKLFNVVSYNYSANHVLATFSSEEVALNWMKQNKDKHKYGRAWTINVSYLDDFYSLQD